MVSFLPDSIKYKQMISKATSDDEVPSPAYIQDELKQLTFNGGSCKYIEDALMSRLETKSSNVKLKGLRLLKLLCEKGSPNFKRDVQRRVHIVRDCLHWRCDPHPTMGELPAKMVRQAAQDTLNTIMDSSMPDAAPPAAAAPQAPPAAQAQQYHPPAQAAAAAAPSPTSGGFAPALDKSRYGGFGRDSFQGNGNTAPPERSILSYASGQGASSSSEHGRMQGFGSPATHAQGVVMPATPQQGVEMAMQAGAKAASTFAHGLTSLKDTVVANAAGRPMPSKQQTGEIYSNKGGGRLSAGGTAYSSASPPSWKPPTQAAAGGDVASGGVERSKVSVEPGSWEESLVDKICQPGGVRAVPGKDELKQFGNALTMSTDGGRLLQGMLISKLYSDQWQARLKALHAFREMLRNESGDVRSMIRTFLLKQTDAVEQLTSSPHASLADLAAKVLNEIRGEPELQEGLSQNGAAAAVGNLIDAGDGPPTQVAGGVGGGGGLFEGLVVAPSGQAGQAAAAAASSSGPGVAGAGPRAPGEGVSSMFDGLSMSGGTQQQAPSVTTETAGQSGGDIMSLLDGGGQMSSGGGMGGNVSGGSLLDALNGGGMGNGAKAGGGAMMAGMGQSQQMGSGMGMNNGSTMMMNHGSNNMMMMGGGTPIGVGMGGVGGMGQNNNLMMMGGGMQLGGGMGVQGGMGMNNMMNNNNNNNMMQGMQQQSLGGGMQGMGMQGGGMGYGGGGGMMGQGMQMGGGGMSGGLQQQQQQQQQHGSVSDPYADLLSAPLPQGAGGGGDMLDLSTPPGHVRQTSLGNGNSMRDMQTKGFNAGAQRGNQVHDSFAFVNIPKG